MTTNFAFPALFTCAAWILIESHDFIFSKVYTSKTSLSVFALVRGKHWSGKIVAKSGRNPGILRILSGLGPQKKLITISA